MPSNDFFEAAKILGALPEFVQGGGGNISEKEGELMAVKASGCLLRDLGPGVGYAVMRYIPLAKHLVRELRNEPDRRKHEHEAELNAMIDTNVLSKESFGSPSMEAGMHAVLGKYVFHTHNVYTNVFACMEDGRNILGELFGDSAVCIPYRNPGKELAIEITRAIQKNPNLPATLILENHGVLTHGDDFRKVLSASIRANDSAAIYLASRGVPPFRVLPQSADFSRHLFPDSAVYSQIDPQKLSEVKRRAFYEISSMVNYILSAIQTLGGTPRFISDEDVLFIRGMEKEKTRAAMAA